MTFKIASDCLSLEVKALALAGVAQWIEHRPANLRVTFLVPSQDTCLGCGPRPQQGVHERLHIDISLFPSLPLSLKINKYNLKKKK